jgi:G8 domain
MVVSSLVNITLDRRRKSEMYYMYGDDNPFGGGKPTNGTNAVEPKSPVDNFVPLSCNTNLKACVGWTVYFGTDAVQNNRLVVRCGDCVTMDFAGPSVTLNDGIDINGKLIFPENYSVTLYTAGIVVQGELEMQSKRAPISGTPQIQFIMIGVNDDRSFVPVGENAAACGRLALANNSCLVGKKSITVAGGKMNGMCYYTTATTTYSLFLTHLVLLCLFSSFLLSSSKSMVFPATRQLGPDCTTSRVARPIIPPSSYCRMALVILRKRGGSGPKLSLHPIPCCGRISSCGPSRRFGRRVGTRSLPSIRRSVDQRQWSKAMILPWKWRCCLGTLCSRVVPHLTMEVICGSSIHQMSSKPSTG